MNNQFYKDVINFSKGFMLGAAFALVIFWPVLAS